MVITAEQQAFLQSLINHGIGIEAGHWALGHVNLRPDQVEAFTQDEDQFAADQHGVTKEHLLAWGGFMRKKICLGTTKLGKPCRNLANNGDDVDSPELFVSSNVNCYCHTHRPI